MAKKDFMTLMREKTVDVRPSMLSAESTIKSQVVILNELRDLIPPLTSEELDQLTRNLLQHGVKDPLTIWETTAVIAGLETSDTPAYVLIDGHNRYAICTKHQLDYRINIVQFDSLDAVKEYMIRYQLGRRNLTPEQISYLRGLRYLQQKAVRGSNLRADAPVVNVADTLAAEYGVSSRTIKRDGDFAASLNALPAEDKKAILTGKQRKTKASVAATGGPDATILPVTTDIPAEGVGQSVAAQIERLQTRIQKLANGRLTPRTCTELINKATEIMGLLSSK